MGSALPQGRWLHLYAADLVRNETGQFEVLSDRTQAPSGAGYTLENRIVLSRALPSVFRQCKVQRLAPFFVSLRETLTELAPANHENPRIVLFTPGPYNETYFEHSFLARYLGYALVQGNDLTVRDTIVYMKTLGGLQRVDVILRRVDDNFCDPLELLSGFLPGRAGIAAGGSPRQCGGGQRDRLRRFAGAWISSLSSRGVPVSSGRGIEAAFGANLVVRPAGHSGIRRSAACRKW